MPRETLGAIVILLVSAMTLTACDTTASQPGLGSNIKTASTTPISHEALTDLGDKWQANPRDVSKGLAYANGLESLGQSDAALGVYQKLSEAEPDNAKVTGLYGRKLVAGGKARAAIPVLEGAERGGESDWRVTSALGTAYDQTGLYQKAREQYAKVLTADPKNLAVMNDLAMSYALEGKLSLAETELRAADSLPGSSSEPSIRQNLALVVGLQGRFDEATQLAQDGLPPAQVQENMAYLKKMLSQPNTWQQVSDRNKKG